jgi:hypothetical protein
MWRWTESHIIPDCLFSLPGGQPQAQGQQAILVAPRGHGQHAKKTDLFLLVSPSSLACVPPKGSGWAG